MTTPLSDGSDWTFELLEDYHREIVRIAEAFADRIISAAANPDERIDLAHRLCYVRPATESEHMHSKKYIDQFQSELQAGQVIVENPERAAWASLAKILLSSSEFIYLD